MRKLILSITFALLVPFVNAQGQTTHFASITCPAQTVNDCSKEIKDGPVKALYPTYSMIKGYVEKQNQVADDKKQNMDFCINNYTPQTSIKVFTDNIQTSLDEGKEETLIIDGYTYETDKDQLRNKSSYKSFQKTVDYYSVEIDMIGLESVLEKGTVNLFTVQGGITQENITKWNYIDYYELKDCIVTDPRKYN